MVVRKIIKIDESRCDGCGQCVTACAEGAISIEDGKARVISESYCDGLGACLGQCPKDALSIEEREAVVFDAESAAHNAQSRPKGGYGGSPGKAADSGDRLSRSGGSGHRGVHGGGHGPGCFPAFDMGIREAPRGERSSPQLTNWPVQMRLVNPAAPYLNDSSLLIAADCSAFATPAAHDFMAGKVTLIGCPKLDDAGQFRQKLAEILKSNKIRDITVLQMEVPCCSALTRMVEQVVRETGRAVPVISRTLGIRGDILI